MQYALPSRPSWWRRRIGTPAAGEGALPYGLSFAQLTDLISLLNVPYGESYKDANGVVQPCGHASKFAQTHLYQLLHEQQRAFAGKRPASISLFAPTPAYNTSPARSSTSAAVAAGA
jgi:hypothetical protein